MKKILIVIIAVLFTVQVNAQGVSISDDGSQPDASAQLDVQSSTKGFLPPVMTETERNAISNPAEGLQIYNRNTKKPNYYNGNEWMNFDGTSAATPVTDADGNIYTSVIIGTQEWLEEDLKTTTYNDGTAIPFVAHNGTWVGLTTPACTFYDTDLADGTQDNTDYGYLYNWYVVDEVSNGSKNVCPVGWHVPSDTEWTALETELDPDGLNIAGGKLKETGYTHWNEDASSGATNESEFSALPGGFRRGSSGTFGNVGNYGYWWSATQNDETSAQYRKLYYNNVLMNRSYENKSYGFSVRCIKD